MIDRRPIYLVGSIIGLVVVGYLYFFSPRVTPEARVREQVAILAVEPWNYLVVQEVQYRGPLENPEQVMIRGYRASNGAPVLVHFVDDSPYTAPTAMRRLAERPLEGQTAEVLMVPRSFVLGAFRDEFDQAATHAGVALFAGIPEEPIAEASPEDVSDPGSMEEPVEVLETESTEPLEGEEASPTPQEDAGSASG